MELRLDCGTWYLTTLKGLAWYFKIQNFLFFNLFSGMVDSRPYVSTDDSKPWLLFRGSEPLFFQRWRVHHMDISGRNQSTCVFFDILVSFWNKTYFCTVTCEHTFSYNLRENAFWWWLCLQIPGLRRPLQSKPWILEWCKIGVRVS